MKSYKNIGLIYISLTLLFFFINKPIFSHGSNGDCSEECSSYYCPDIDKESDNKINSKE